MKHVIVIILRDKTTVEIIYNFHGVALDSHHYVVEKKATFVSTNLIASQM